MTCRPAAPPAGTSSSSSSFFLDSSQDVPPVRSGESSRSDRSLSSSRNFKILKKEKYKEKPETPICKNKSIKVYCDCVPVLTDRAAVHQAVVEAGHPAEHLLAVRVQLLQLVLHQHGVQRGALLDQVLPEHNQSVDLVGVQSDFLLEALNIKGEKKTIWSLRKPGLKKRWRCALCNCQQEQTYVELPHLVLDVALGEMLHVGELQVHLCEPDQDPLPSPLKVLSLRGESAENRNHPLLQAVPPLVPLLDEELEFAGGVGAVLPGQTAVLFVDQLQLSQTLVDLPLERLTGQQKQLTTAHLILLSMDVAQMFLQRRSRLRVVCWMESFSASLPQASASCSRTSQSVSTDATLSKLDSTFVGSCLYKITALWVSMVTHESLKSPSTRELFQLAFFH
ncbi:hypothetical protein F7725_008249 [Dissostichus mawsoni]|uniref:Uncharacterized protein n=1 Tax=Dissostichus mawsoni TaxID=36200 RepID=A0A7J5Y6L0_DISMA|nr:hypothetical protein F7725_008249 [Dissostichus mawsoni]